MNTPVLVRILRFIFYRVCVRLIVLIVLGVNVRHSERLPKTGPAIIVANHNSHLDTMVLITLLPASLLPHIRPVAAAEYFLRNPLMAWLSTRIIGILPISRSGSDRSVDPLAECHEALARGDILVLFPEGSRGVPERLERFKSGIARLAERHPRIPVVPVFLHGLGKALPRGETLLVPFFCDVFVGEALLWDAPSRAEYMATLESMFDELAAEGQFPTWE